MFDAMGALSSKYNETPDKASRTYDANRDGFVISGGGGIVVLEEYEHAKARGATIYAEVVGYGATSPKLAAGYQVRLVFRGGCHPAARGTACTANRFRKGI